MKGPPKLEGPDELMFWSKKIFDTKVIKLILRYTFLNQSEYIISRTKIAFYNVSTHCFPKNRFSKIVTAAAKKDFSRVALT